MYQEFQRENARPLFLCILKRSDRVQRPLESSEYFRSFNLRPLSSESHRHCLEETSVGCRYLKESVNVSSLPHIWVGSDVFDVQDHSFLSVNVFTVTILRFPSETTSPPMSHPSASGTLDFLRRGPLWNFPSSKNSFPKVHHDSYLLTPMERSGVG